MTYWYWKDFQAKCKKFSARKTSSLVVFLGVKVAENDVKLGNANEFGFQTTCPESYSSSTAILPFAFPTLHVFRFFMRFVNIDKKKPITKPASIENWRKCVPYLANGNSVLFLEERRFCLRMNKKLALIWNTCSIIMDNKIFYYP